MYTVIFQDGKVFASGLSPGSILDPLLFNIYINDIIYFVDERNLAYYADGNTPNATDTDPESLIRYIENDVKTLIKWFNDNHMKLNEDKCNHDEEILATIGRENILGRTSENYWRLTETTSFVFRSMC